MSVSSQETVFHHVGNGVSVTFAFGCQVPLNVDLSVYVNDVLTTTGFSVSGIGNPTGGSITFAVAPANLVAIRIERDIELERTTDYQQNGDFLSRVVNPDFDRLWMALQQQFSSLRRAIKVPKSDALPPSDLPSAAARANNLLAFDSNGNPIAVAPAAQSATALQVLLATILGSSLIGFIQAGIGAVLRTVQSKLRDSVSLADFGAVPGGDITAIFAVAKAAHKTLFVTADYKTTGLTIDENITLIFAGGSINALNAESRMATVTNAAHFDARGLKSRGFRETNEAIKSSHCIVVDNGTVDIGGGSFDIGYWAGMGLFFNSGGSSAALSDVGRGRIHHCGTGIETNDYEYLHVNGTTVYECGFNNARTDWAHVGGPGTRTGWGIHGKGSNCTFQNFRTNSNAIGFEIDSFNGLNPDHNMVVDFVANHNVAAGVIIKNLHSYLTLRGTMLSNVVSASAPDVTFAGTGTSFDLALINVVGLQVDRCNIGTGSGGAIPIYGHARCRYTGNNLVGASFSEIAHPQVGSPVYDFYGYNKNGDNIFEGNMCRNDSTPNLKPTILADSVRTVIKNEIESAGAGAGSGGGKLIDDVAFVPVLVNGWTDVVNMQKSWVSRRANGWVDIYICVKPTIGTGTTITTLPPEYRPTTGNAFLSARAGPVFGTGMPYGSIQTSGVVTIAGAVLNEPTLMHGTYRVQ